MTDLVGSYDLVIFDLDGVIYLIDRPIPGAPEAVAKVKRRGIPVEYATNNASRRAVDVAELLTGMGVTAGPHEVTTSSQAAADEVVSRHGRGAIVLVVGSDALRGDLTDAGLATVDRAEHEPVAVVQGYSAHVGWADLAEACVAVRGGASWVATNLDATLPSPRGPLPGNGSLVAVLRTALGREPDVVVGKPEPGLFTTAARRARASRPLVVGDRLDTDIAGARRAGLRSLLVLTGVSTLEQVLAAPEEQRPDFVATDLSGLFTVDAEPFAPIAPDQATVGDWTARRDGDTIRLTGDGRREDAFRALCGVAWAGDPPRHVEGLPR